MPDLVPIRRALLSVSDKSGLEPLVRALAARNVDIVSTGGTARYIESLGVPVTPVEKLTGFPEMMDGRVRTLHPKVHGGLLAVRDNPEHVRSMAEHQIAPIDLIVINLYPFEQTVSRAGVTEDECVEQIDIGGPAMVRSAAKNHAYVTVVTDSHQYGRLLNELDHHRGGTTLALRRHFAGAAYARTAAYDAAIAGWFGSREAQPVDHLPEVFRVAFPKHQELRYGENPHQRAAVYRDPAFKGGAGSGSSVLSAVQLHGKELSYNNINDAAAALAVVDDLAAMSPSRPAACVIKHANPCGAATGSSPLGAIDSALRGDALAAFGGILACSAPIDAAAAERLGQPGAFLEVILAPSFSQPALDILRAKWAHVRLLATGAGMPVGGNANGGGASGKTALPSLVFRSIIGGMLVQDRDHGAVDIGAWHHRAGPVPTDDRLGAAAALWVVVKHLSSNAVAVGGSDPEQPGSVLLLGAGAGQMDRVTSCRLACEKSAERARAVPGGAIAVSDAFFPFPDGPQLLIDAGVTLIVHTGGSKRDHETFDLCERRGVSCVTTGVRHFRH